MRREQRSGGGEGEALEYLGEKCSERREGACQGSEGAALPAGRRNRKRQEGGEDRVPRSNKEASRNDITSIPAPPFFSLRYN